MDESFGAQIRRRRLERGWSLRDLADYCCLDRATIQSIELGIMGRPVREETARRLLAALGVPELSPELRDMLDQIERDVLDGGDDE